jgi:protein arginine N-methyltransferase 1
MLRRVRGKLAAKILCSERLNTWVYPAPEPAAEPSKDERYRDFNRSYFAQFYEQEKMLADRPRMDFYHAAIARHIKPGDRVIDLGTGTGILAAFASRRGAGKVYAIDHSVVLEHAKTLAAHNHIENVEFVSTHSKDLKLDAPVDVILHEQMGDYLFDEDMVANITDLRERLLKPGGLILPARFELFCEPVKIRDERLVPHLWNMNVHGVDYSCMDRERPQDPHYYHIPASDLNYVDYFLGDVAPLLSVDLQTLDVAKLCREFHFTRTIKRAGRFDGYVIFFRAMVDDDLSINSNPLDPGRATNWGYRILRTDPDQFEEGDILATTLTIGHWPEVDTWRWNQVKTKPVA